MKHWIYVLLLLLVAQGVARPADLVPLGPEFVVTSSTAYVQKQPWTACDNEGDFVVVYSRGDVYARLLRRDGVPLNSDFLVNPTINYGEQDEVFAAMDPATGDFVLVWSDRHGNDGWEMGIGGRFYAANGTPYGPEFILNAHTAYSQFEPHAAFSACGRVFVVWTDAGTDGSAGVIGRMFDRYGNALTGELLLNQPNSFTQINPSVSCNAYGDFVVAFEDASGVTGQAREVQARLFDVNGQPKGPQFPVNSVSAGTQTDPLVAMNADGEFVVVFQDGSGNDGSGYGVYARCYDEQGAALGPQFCPCQATSGNQLQPHVAADWVGNFIVSWEDAGGADSEVKARRYDRLGSALSGEFVVHAPGKSGSQSYQKFALSQGGQRFVAVWFDSNSDSYARLFHLPMIVPSAPAAVGTIVQLALDLPGSGGHDYLLLAALSTSPAIPLSGGRALELYPDPLLLYTLTVPNGPVFTGLAGQLDPAGAATAAFAIPGDPGLVGLQIHFAALTYRGGSLLNLGQVTDPFTLTLQ